MADKTGIVWTDATWNPVTGCAKVSAGCKHCYAERNWGRLQHLPAYAGRAFTDVATHADRLDQPIRWAKRRMIFVNSMSDLFHPAVPDDFIDSVFGIMWACLYGRNEQDGHVFQVLTKRADRMRDYMSTDRREAWARAAVHHGGGIDPDGIFDQTLSFEGPHPRIWLGVSVEDQAAADERIPLLLDTPAAVRWISAEPLLGPVDLSPAYLPCPNAEYVIMDPETGGYECCSSCDYTGISDEIGIDWVVVGGESGPKARPMHPAWARSLRDQCAAAAVPFLFKQWGEWQPVHPSGASIPGCGTTPQREPAFRFEHDHYFTKVGKKAAGRLLDSVLHDGYPTFE